MALAPPSPQADQTPDLTLVRLDPTSFAVRAYFAFRYPLLVFLLVEIVGSIGFWIVSEHQASLLDCVYMTFITVATIGFGETIDLSHSAGGRVFLMAIATVGIANVTYATSKLTAFILEKDISAALRRRRMQDQIDTMSNHFIICGVGRVGSNVAHELSITGRAFVGIEEAPAAIEQFREKHPRALVLHGDCSDDDMLARAGVARAAGLFAVTGDDGKNLLITLSAKQINPAARVVARVHDVRNSEKLKRVGADAIVSPDFTGGMRIASSMLRPAVVTFLDEMLRTDDKLRIEEVVVPDSFDRRSLGEAVPANEGYVVLAVRTAGGWQFNPSADYRLQRGNVLIAMATPQGRRILESVLSAA
ncbi:MAG TPA: potassium channel protein [Burkholderiales bacterium]|nr:potassium channel protein [Burkholderiales bacterium]